MNKRRISKNRYQNTRARPRQGVWHNFAEALGIDRASKENEHLRSMVEYLGYTGCDQSGILDCKNGDVARLLRVNSTDLYSLDDETLSKYLDAFTNFNRIYTPDYKVIIMSARINVTQQELYIRHLIQNLHGVRTPEARIRRRLLGDSLNEITEMSRDVDRFSDMKFYIEIFANNKDVMATNTRTALAADQNGLLGLRTCLKDETEGVLYRMNNLNSK